MADNNDERTELQKYICLIKKYLDSNISVVEFEREFLKVFKNEEYFFSPQKFRSLDLLFAAVDDYPSEVSSDSGLDSDGLLRNACSKTLSELLKT